MFKVLIIDDEPIIRKGLKNIIHWRQFDCEICGEAADGLQGQELIRQLKPDIILTDIKMPELDGLGMIREVREQVPGSKIIILTGYRDFDYAQEAVKLGAFDFILKPSKIEELTAVIRRAVKELKFQSDKAEEINKLRTLFEQNIPVLREKLLNDLMYGITAAESDIRAQMELFGLRIGEFVLGTVENEREEEHDKRTEQYDRHLYQFGIINTLEEVFSEEFSITSLTLNNRWVAFVAQPLLRKGSILDRISNKCAYLQQIIQNCFGFTVTIALSSEGNGYTELPAKLRECREALEHKFYLGSNAIICYNDLNTFFKYEDYSLLEQYQKMLLETIKAGNVLTVREKLLLISEYTNGLGTVDREYMKNFYWGTLSAINNIRVSVPMEETDRKVVNKDIGSLYKLIDKCDNLKELNGLLEDIALNVAEKVNGYNNKSMKLILRKAVDYLNAHYCEPVTLNEVAENIYVSTYYISRMFKKELGKNFVDYLNEIRIEKAKEMLYDVRYKTYEIAEAVGIPDAHYFSKLFKKYAGVTPTEFRETCSGGLV